MAIRILIVDDHQLMRQGLISMLNGEPDLEVVGEAGDGREALQVVCSVNPDVVILDISMPDLNGVDAARRILSEAPTARILALSMHLEHRFVIEMFKAGASGYLPKNCAFEELARAVRTVCSGQKYLSPTIAGPVLEDYLGRITGGGKTVSSVLSSREREVLQLVAEGKSSKQIASLLHISINTVVRHRQHIMQKLGIRNVAELTRYAIREGLAALG